MDADTIDILCTAIPCIIIGIGIGGIIDIFLFPIQDATDFIEEIKQAQEDCKIKEYYYMDAHRSFCDKLGVTP